jgi:putative heme-binding domain-containing protein
MPLYRFALPIALVTVMLGASAAQGGDPFAAGVRETPPLSPADEQKSFHLPPGFAIELFAAEPDIQKPINMAFDARGRLWVTGSVEYPYAADLGKPGRDTVKVLEDNDGDGRVDKITTFAAGLNIPIGVYPYRQGAIVFSIPNIYYLADTDGDGRADRRDVLYGPFGYQRDTHGLNNAFRRGFDGWIYACHGFQNESNVTARDGSSVSMQSGNVYRFRPDGSHIEQFTWGQVNPFGLTFDAMGQLYSADCHTRPIMLLLRGGYYDSFGKPHDGLGYVPQIMTHDHGSTAIAGTTCYLGDAFPPQFQGNMFAGNVMTSRVNRDSLHFVGATVQAREEPDFLTTDDPWFRPVDLQVGPDGALYIADFYNRVIGHYEVPLDHPGRDRHRGRIWRVSYRGASRSTKVPDLSQASISELIERLSDPNLGLRMRAADELTDRWAAQAIEPLQTALAKRQDPTGRAQILWCLFRLGALAAQHLTGAATDADPLVRIHALRILAETPTWDGPLRGSVMAALGDPDPFVRRAAVEAIGVHPDASFVEPLLALRQATPRDDVHLTHAIKIALRNCLKPSGSLARAAAGNLSADQRGWLAEVCLGLPSEDAGAYLLDYVDRFSVDAAAARRYLSHAARHLPGGSPDRVADIARKKAADDVDLQVELLLAVRDGLRQRGIPDSEQVRRWARELAARLLAPEHLAEVAWRSFDKQGDPARPWGIEPRRTADGAVEMPFLSSLPLGESWMGTLRSRQFAIPPQLRFYVCGHLGDPAKPAKAASFVRLRLGDSGEIVARAVPPRSDTAQPISWDLNAYLGRQAYLEIEDGVDEHGFAWLAVAGFDPPVVRIPGRGLDVVQHRYAAVADLVAALGLSELTAPLQAVLRDADLPGDVRFAAARALANLKSEPIWSALAALLGEPRLPSQVEQRITRLLAGGDGSAEHLLVEAMRSAPIGVQYRLAEALAASREGAKFLMRMVESGQASAYLLQQPALVRQLSASLDDADSRIDAIVATLPNRQESVDKLLSQRRASYATATPSPERGLEVFKRHCAACHQLAGTGAIIGPQLDGIGNRGVDRIIEDILDPNRNIDQAFRSSVYVLDDGRILNGLFRREEGELIVIADQQGKEVSFAKELVQERQPAALSLMPDNFGGLIAENEFHDLISFLAAQRSPTTTQSPR